ncbi:MAG: hypothetical protein AAF363_19430 [Bacteroidota bacterium]
MLRVVNIQGSEKSFQKEGLSFARISSAEEVVWEELNSCDALVIDNPSFVSSICSAVRRHQEVVLALKPIFHNDPGLTDRLTDGYFSGAQKDYQKIKSIHERLQMIQYQGASLNNNHSMTRLTQYLFTRNILLKPYNNRLSSIGYLFPFLDSYVDIKKQHDVLDILAKAEEKGYLTGKTHDKIHQCKSCKGNYLNFRETCPSCHSLDITPKDLIHHFVCAHVAEEETFFKNGEMQCPKCDRKMRHIGIDYDKPSSVYTCNCCQNQFQEPEMIAFCMDCQTEQNLDELQEAVIREYGLTAKGEEFAKYGNQSPAEDNSTENLSPFLFKILCKQEVERIKSRNIKSYLLEYKVSTALFGKFDNRTKEALKAEIEKIINSYLPGSDAVSAKRFNHYQVLLADYKENTAIELRNLIEVNLNKLLSDNFSNNDNLIGSSMELLNEQLLNEI